MSLFSLVKEQRQMERILNRIVECRSTIDTELNRRIKGLTAWPLNSKIMEIRRSSRRDEFTLHNYQWIMRVQWPECPLRLVPPEADTRFTKDDYKWNEPCTYRRDRSRCVRVRQTSNDFLPCKGRQCSVFFFFFFFSFLFFTYFY